MIEAHKLFTEEQRQKLLSNACNNRIKAFDPVPVVKWFTPDGSATWLITELDPDDEDIAFGLCDLGVGSPELGYVSIAEITEVRGGLGLRVERDLWFRTDEPLSVHTDRAVKAGRIEA